MKNVKIGIVTLLGDTSKIDINILVLSNAVYIIVHSTNTLMLSYHSRQKNMLTKTVQIWKCHEMENKYLTNMATMLAFIRMMEKSLQLDLSYHDLMKLLILSKKSFYNRKETILVDTILKILTIDQVQISTVDHSSEEGEN